VWSPLFVTGANINQSAVSLCTVVMGSCPDFLLNIMRFREKNMDWSDEV
jgi:hypothetical protein